MKSIVRMSAVAVVLLAATTAFGDITNSKHNLMEGSADLGQDITGLDQICLPCHVPHNPQVTGANLPLWNHAATVVTTWTFSSTVRGNTGNADGASKLCLGCHDGVTALDNYGGAGQGGATMGLASAVVDPTEDHPIGIAYPPPDPNSNGSPYATLSAAKTAGASFPNDQIECQSCHDPHDTTEVKFLRETTVGSALCKMCHLL